VVFLTLSPIIVLYVKGLSFDFENNKFVETGTLAVKIEPKSADIFLDGTLKKKESGNIKFLKPREYQLEIKEEGYFEWSKRLKIDSGRVIWANGDAEKIYLIKQNGVPAEISQGVSDFKLTDNSLWFLATGSLAYLDIDRQTEPTSYKLDKKLNVIAGNFQNRQLLLKNIDDPTVALLFDASVSTTTDLSLLFPDGAEFKFDPSGKLLALENQNLYLVNFKNSQADSKTLLLTEALAFAANGEDLYYIKSTEQGNALFTSKFPFTKEFILADSLPNFEEGEIIVNLNKEIFLTADKILFRITNKSAKLATDLTGWNFAENQNTLIFAAAGELKQFNYIENKKPGLITRTQKTLTNPSLIKNIGYAFAVQDKNIVALGLDTRDHQNEYNIYYGEDLKKFGVNNAGKKIIILDGDRLLELVIR